MKKWTPELLQAEALKYKTRGEFRKNSPGAYSGAHKRSIFDKICQHMGEPLNKIHSYEECKEVALKYNNMADFYTKSRGYYDFACRNGFLKEIAKHMSAKRRGAYSTEELKDMASKCKTRNEFQENYHGAYLAALRLGILDKICSHMPKNVNIGKASYRQIWNDESLQEEALKYSAKCSFKKDRAGAYSAAARLGILDRICQHMEPQLIYWTDDLIQEKASKYSTRGEFFRNDQCAYTAATNRNILDQVCSHMGKPGSTSLPELSLIDTIKEFYPTAKKIRDMTVNIPNKSHIKGFDVDIYIPELNKGIEFDGTYWHSVEGLRRSRKNWPDEDIKNYHQIKDNHFLSKGVIILHISEEEWLKDRTQSLNKALCFLRNP